MVKSRSLEEGIYNRMKDKRLQHHTNNEMKVQNNRTQVESNEMELGTKQWDPNAHRVT